VINDKLGVYTAQVTALEARIDAVTSQLYLDDDGSFNHTKLMTGFSSGLQSNLNSFKARSDELQQEIRDDVDDVIGFTTTNPRSKY
jgi:hypothetical protein